MEHLLQDEKSKKDHEGERIDPNWGTAGIFYKKIRARPSLSVEDRQEFEAVKKPDWPLQTHSSRILKASADLSRKQSTATLLAQS